MLALILPDKLSILFRRLIRNAQSQLSSIGWRSLLILCTLHASITYLSFILANETTLLNFNKFMYFYATTSTTVGYGDFSPQTTLGRWVTITWVMPGGISLFSTIIAKLATTVATSWRSKMTGHGDCSSFKDHIVIIGYQRQATPRLVELLLGDVSEKRRIVLASTKPTENPMPNKIEFVRGETLTDQSLIQRSGVQNASLIMAYAGDDPETLSAALAACAANSTAHVVAYFNTQSSADVLRMHCPQAEVIVSLKVENLVRAAQDPGSSQLTAQLLSSLNGQTVYSTALPSNKSYTFDAIFDSFKARHKAIVLGYSMIGQDNVILNPTETTQLNSEDRVFYIAAQRIDESLIQWPE